MLRTWYMACDKIFAVNIINDNQFTFISTYYFGTAVAPKYDELY